MPKRVTNGGAHLSRLAPGLVVTVSELTGLGIKPHTFHRHSYVAGRPAGSSMPTNDKNCRMIALHTFKIIIKAFPSNRPASDVCQAHGNRCGGLAFDFRVGQIGYSVAKGSQPLHATFLRSSVAPPSLHDSAKYRERPVMKIYLLIYFFDLPGDH